MVGRCERVHDGDPQRADPLGLGGDDVEPAGLDDVPAEFQLKRADPIRRGIAQPFGQVAEYDDVALGFVQRLKIVGRLEFLVELPTHVERDVDHVGE